MFSYVDSEIRKKLKDNGQIVWLNQKGETVSEDHEKTPVISLLGPIPLPVQTDAGETRLLWYPFVRRVELHQVLRSAQAVTQGSPETLRGLLQETMNVNSVLATPDFASLKNPLVRIHSCCLTGDTFGSLRCECGPQLDSALVRISREGGAVVYMSGHEGRGIGLWAKAVTYLLQDAGEDTYQANVSLGLPEDSRDFSDAAAVLRHLLRDAPIRLMSNNPLKKQQMEAAGQSVSELIPHVAGIGKYNARYMEAKKHRGHLLP